MVTVAWLYTNIKADTAASTDINRLVLGLGCQMLRQQEVAGDAYMDEV